MVVKSAFLEIGTPPTLTGGWFDLAGPRGRHPLHPNPPLNWWWLAPWAALCVYVCREGRFRRWVGNPPKATPNHRLRGGLGGEGVPPGPLTGGGWTYETP